MEKMTLVQARTPEKVKADAADILSRLGLNLSTYINMSLNQLVIQEGIPFEVKLKHSPYTAKEAVSEVEATMKMEGMQLTPDDIKLLEEYRSGMISGEVARKQILREV
ncbi:type II toxin-antitoxin system RelB/DinJ family antitoxin [[Clostridium] polysaccharolyticum]|uniref:RelB antitoxin n=1 Tax=[Clostridium] polysaccharolyticum TaxID=29364 RepID=A0A1H9Y7Y7_9FIRM|nr:type II toxin-antitoxin system RelB/DinJ family antitoxin [[Clostridium] polysaccharolyticum]SES64926.1 RelB antitoxin [[Clostridium] polysaccharolyticum]